MFLVSLVVFLGVKFGFRKSCLCKRNDKYEVWEQEDANADDADDADAGDVHYALIMNPYL